MRTLAILCLWLAACPAGEGAGSSSELVAVGPRGVAVSLAERFTVTRGITGDQRYVFVGEILAGRLMVLDRFTGAEVAEVPPPPGGWALLFAPKLRAPGELY